MLKTTSARSATSRGVVLEHEPGLDERRRLRARPVVAVDGVPGGEQPPHDAASHHAEPDEADFRHPYLPLSRASAPVSTRISAKRIV